MLREREATGSCSLLFPPLLFAKCLGGPGSSAGDGEKLGMKETCLLCSRGWVCLAGEGSRHPW